MTDLPGFSKSVYDLPPTPARTPASELSVQIAVAKVYEETMDWRQALLVALATYAVTKTVDHLLAISKEKRDFKKYRREKVHAEIEELKDEVGRLYELSANWNSYDAKSGDYVERFAKDYYLVGKYNKYPEIAVAARDTVHWCKIVGFSEKDSRDDLIQNKKELTEKYRIFIQTCDTYVASLV